MEKIEVRKPTKEEIEETKNWPVWTKEISEFDWEYDRKETCYILEGSARIKAPGEKEVHISAGDWVVFPQGLKCIWTIDLPIAKRYKFG